MGATGRSLQRIATQVAEMNAVVGEIAVGAQQQATALRQVNGAIEEMNRATQENATMVEESTAAGHSLAEQSVSLSRLVSQFRIAEGSGAESEERPQAELAQATPQVFDGRQAEPAATDDQLARRRAAKLAVADGRRECVSFG